MLEQFESGDQPDPNLEQYDEKLHKSFRPNDGLPKAVEQQAIESENNRRLEEAADRIRGVDGLNPDAWREMNIYEKRTTLNAVGRELQDVYHQPAPPLEIVELEDKGALGSYGDGQKYNAETGQLEGADYGMKMNQNASAAEGDLFGDDPKAALRTYAHEFRHSYQHEQANRFEQPQFRNLVDDPQSAGKWSDNLPPRDYVSPSEDYEAYRNQPVEADARAFADNLVHKVYH